MITSLSGPEVAVVQTYRTIYKEIRNSASYESAAMGAAATLTLAAVLIESVDQLIRAFHPTRNVTYKSSE